MPKKNEEISLNKIPATSPDLRKDMLDKIREIYPALFGEGNSLNAKELQSLVDDYSKPEAERYSFPWAGKTASKRFAFTPSKARLVPDKERSVDFDTTQNLIIEGENLEVLKLLQASYFKKVKMIYIDPPYNTGHDFVYPDDYSESKQAYWEKNGVYHDGVRMDTNTESSGRYHSNWLSMMQSRLLLGRNLLRDDGVIFASIDDNEVHNLRKLMDDIFGEENFLVTIVWEKGRKNDSTYFSESVEYMHVYAKSIETLRDQGVWRERKPGIDRILAHYSQLKEKFASDHKKIESGMKAFYSELEKEDPVKNLEHFFRSDSRGLFFGADISSASTSIPDYEVLHPVTEKPVKKPSRGWGCTEEVMLQRIAEDRVLFGEDESTIPLKKSYLYEVDTIVKTPVIYKDGRAASITVSDLVGKGVFENPKDHWILAELLGYSSKDPSAVILDFFAGSGSTAHALMELNKQDGGNRKFILIQIPEATDEKSVAYKAGYKTISQITIERVKRAGEEMKDKHGGEMGTYNGTISLGIGKKKEMEIPFLPDVGFKTFRLSKSLFPQNMFEIDPDMTEAQKVKSWEEYLEKSKQSHLFDFNLDELLVEIALKDGFDLNFKVEPVKGFKKNKVLNVSDGEKTALVCLDENIQEDTIKDLEPYMERRFICLERAVDSTRKWNLKRMFGDNLWVA